MTLRDKLLGLLSGVEERQAELKSPTTTSPEAEMSPVTTFSAPSEKTESKSPVTILKTESELQQESCSHPVELIAVIGGVGKRCGACGLQWPENQATNGISRADFFAGRYDRRKVRVNSG